MTDAVTVSAAGIDIKDIPQVNDADFSITLNGFFLIRWTDTRLIIREVKFGADGDELVPVDISLVSKTYSIFSLTLLVLTGATYEAARAT